MRGHTKAVLLLPVFREGEGKRPARMEVLYQLVVVGLDVRFKSIAFGRMFD